MMLLYGLLISSVYSCPNESISKSWFDEELIEKKSILEAFWQERILQYNQNSVNEFKIAIINGHYPKDILWEEKINKLFDEAADKKINFDFFFNTLKDQPFVLINVMNEVEKLIPQKQFKDSDPHINSYNLSKLQQYMRDKHLSASITLGAKNARLITPNFPENDTTHTFAIHSVGKVFTGILTLIMIENNILAEDDLSKPVQLGESTLRQLPQSVREQLKKVTLYQLMTHKAGLGDYLGKYRLAISQGHVPTIKHTEDFLPFVDSETFPIDETRYSNVGILLVGLAIKHAYEKKFHQMVDYNDILQDYIINPVGMHSFSPWRPQNSKYNLNDPIAPQIVGSPAGGYWMTASDLAKFGQWIYKKTRADNCFKMLIEKYGQEFYVADRQLIVHAGGLPSSMAFLSISLKTGGIISICSDQPPVEASDLKEVLIMHMFSKAI